MNDTEEAVHRLFAVAAEDIPPGIDLLRGARARQRARVRHVRVLLSTSMAGVLAIAAAITLSAVRAPSALAQVTQAAARTAAQSYRVSSVTTLVKAPRVGPQPTLAVSGEFDPAQGVGEETCTPAFQIRYVGRYMYLSMDPPLFKAFRAVYDATQKVPIPAGASWLRLPASLRTGRGVTLVEIAQLGSTMTNLEQLNPQDLLALLESASQVREAGPASGSGWTGSAYTFTATNRLGGPFLMTSGTVDVDQQGRVRRLDAVESIGETAWKVEMTFGDFGVPVSVSAPPASETFTPQTRVIVVVIGNTSGYAEPPKPG